MSGVARLSLEEYDDRIDYLLDTSGPDLDHELVQAASTDDRNPAKVVETLRRIAKAAREAALYLEDNGLPDPEEE